MAKIFSASIDVTKISKEKLYKGKKGTYCNVTIVLNDNEDEYGNIISISENQSKEDRENKVKKNYLGNGKLVWSDETDTPSNAEVNQNNQDEDDDVPF